MKNIWHHQFTARIIIGVTMVVSVLLVRNAWEIYSRTRQPVQTDDFLEYEKQKNDKLKQQIDIWGKEFQQELIIREQLNMQKEGEVVLQVPLLPSITLDPAPTPTPTPSALKQWGELLL